MTSNHIAEEFIKQIDGKDFVLYAGLLDLAHQKGLKDMEVSVLQYPSKENDNTVIVTATATTTNGERFTDLGDANAQNCGAKVSKHLIRMASTRAKARCLRDFTNVGMACVDELMVDHETGEVLEETRKPRRQSKPSTQPTASTQSTPMTVPIATSAQLQAIQNLGKRKGVTDSALDTLAQEKFGHGLDKLTSRNASDLIRHLQAA